MKVVGLPRLEAVSGPEHPPDLGMVLLDPLVTRQTKDRHHRIELAELHQDQAKIQQILNNLLSNAIKFTPEGGRINVSASRNGIAELQLIVQDTGVGIAEDDQALIFEKFRQGQSELSFDAMTREHSGTGLGLSIVKELCKLLGGEISLESELGRGSTFTVRLPWVREEEPVLDSPLSDELDELARPRPQLARHQEERVDTESPVVGPP